jgi:hypothetical protein
LVSFGANKALCARPRQRLSIRAFRNSAGKGGYPAKPLLGGLRGDLAWASEGGGTQMPDISAEKWQRVELFYRLECSGNPFEDVSLEARFTSPSGRVIQVEGFYAGEGVWKIRFAPDEPGEWQWDVRLPDSVDSGVLICSDAPAKGLLRADSEYPQRLRFDSGEWFLPLGSGTEPLEPPGLPSSGDPSVDAAAALQAWLDYLDLLVEHRANKLRIWLPPVPAGMPIQAVYSPWQLDPDTGSALFSRFDLSFWDRLDRILAAAAQRDIVVELVLFDPSQVCVDESPTLPIQYEELYLRYLLARTASFWNVCYSIVGSPCGASRWIERCTAFLRSKAPYPHIISAPMPPPGASVPLEEAEPAAQPDAVQCHLDMLPEAGVEVLSSLWSAAKPIFVDEARWVDADRPHGDPANPSFYAQERFWFWLCFVCGAAPSRVPWQTFSETPTLDWIFNLAEFADGVSWWTLAPAHEVVAQATCRAYCAASPTEMVVYCIGSGSGHKVVLRADPGNYQIEFYDPAVGEVVGGASGYSDGRLPLELPEFDEDLALRIRRVMPPHSDAPAE